MLDWARSHLWHFDGGWSTQNYYYNWQYWGYPPVSRVIAGTTNSNPQFPYLGSLGPQHWTAGCDGTTSFLIWVLKAANIPVEALPLDGHTVPWFMGENLYLSHGDDPYSALSKAGYPAKLLLISHDDFQAWFPPNNLWFTGHNVGRRPIDLAVQYPTSNWVLFRYCDDVQANRDHASSKVYNEVFIGYYTVSDLELLGLWDRMQQAVNTLGCPSLPY